MFCLNILSTFHFEGYVEILGLPLLLGLDLSHVMRKLDFCTCENKDADQLRGIREADQRLFFCFIDSTIPLLSKSEISRLQPSSLIVQPGLCGTWSETPKTGFLTTSLICLTPVFCDFLFTVENMTTADVNSYKEIDNKMNDGNKNRTVAATQMNATSRYQTEKKKI